MWSLYALTIDGEAHPFYVGCTARVPKRMIEHGSRARWAKENSRRGELIRSALRSGKRILISSLEQVSDEAVAYEAEKHWIAHFGRADLEQGPLANLTDGGKGVVGYIYGAETRAKMSTAKIGNKINAGRTRLDTVKRFSQPVSAYDQLGNWIETYPSARKAAEATGIHFGSISDACAGRIKCARNKNNVVFQFRKDGKPDNIGEVIYKGHNK